MASKCSKSKPDDIDIEKNKPHSLISSFCNNNTSCQFYLQIKKNAYTRENLLHTDEFRHEKTPCPLGMECRAFVRLNGNGYRHDDIGHCSIDFHQGRRGGMTVQDNLGLKKFFSAHQHWDPNTPTDVSFWNATTIEGDLVKELEKNDFGYVMKPASGPYKHLDEFVREKLNHPKHIRIGSPLNYEQMLAIVLYCGTDAYADMRSDEIQYTMQDFAKFSWGRVPKKQNWPVFSKLLNEAITNLHSSDNYHRPKLVYHGLKDIEVDSKTFNNKGRAVLYAQRDGIEHFKYGTFISTSWDEQVALSFMGNQGTLLEINLISKDSYGANIGADVSWISKFPAESEFLITRCATFNILRRRFDENHNYEIVIVEPGHQCHLSQDDL